MSDRPENPVDSDQSDSVNDEWSSDDAASRFEGATGLLFEQAMAQTRMAVCLTDPKQADVAIFREGIWAMLGSTQGYMGLAWGMAGDKPIPADYDGDGKADPAIFREGIWAMLGSTQGYMGLGWGLPTDTPVPADYDGDGKADPAIYRDGVWAIYGSTSGYIGTLWGLGSDIPLSRR